MKTDGNISSTCYNLQNAILNLNYRKGVSNIEKCLLTYESINE